MNNKDSISLRKVSSLKERMKKRREDMKKMNITERLKQKGFLSQAVDKFKGVKSESGNKDKSFSSRIIEKNRRFFNNLKIKRMMKKKE